MARYIRTVAPDLLIRANAQAVADHETDGTADITTSIVMALGTNHSAEEMTAVWCRLMALTKVLRSPGGEHWTLNIDKKDCTLVNEALFRAAARAPLREKQNLGEMEFNANELLQLALEEASSEGSA
jgi:hypothetical protein